MKYQLVSRFSHSVMSDSLWPNGLQLTRLPCPLPTPRACSNSCQNKTKQNKTHVHQVNDAIQPSDPLHPLLLPSVFPSIRVFSNESFIRIRWSRFGASASASVLPMDIQDWFPVGLTGWISLQSERDSQESSTTPQFKSINYSALSFLYSPTLTSIYDDWKNCSFD